MQIGAERAKMHMRCARVPTEIPFCVPPLLVGTSFCMFCYMSTQHKTCLFFFGGGGQPLLINSQEVFPPWEKKPLLIHEWVKP